jgi:hypothetical protein
MTESIVDYGGVEGDTSQSAVDANIEAIIKASNAASDDTVYLPAGTWYIGPSDPNSGYVLHPGVDAASNLGFVGEGPDESVLKWSPDAVDENADQYYRIAYESSSYGTITWEDFTYDVNWEAYISDNPNADVKPIGVYFEDGGSPTWEMYNVRIINIWRQAFWFFLTDTVNLTVDKCTFRNIGIGRTNRDAANGEKSLSHCFTGVEAGAGGSCAITNSEFVNIAGNVINTNESDTGSYLFENLWIEGVGDAFIKDDGVNDLTFRKIHYRGNTAELEDSLNSAAIDFDFHGRQFLKQLDGSGSPEYTLHNVDARNFVRRAINLRAGGGWTVSGGTDGPVRFQHLNTEGGDRPYAIDEVGLSGAGFDFSDFGQISVHDGDYVFRADDSTGTIDTLRYGDMGEGIGDLGDISIATIDQGASPFQPTVPSQDDVGVTSSNSSPTVSWVAPADEATVSGTITLQADAGDPEDSIDSLNVAYRVDGDTWTSGTYDSTSGYFETSWDSTTVSDGEHVIEVRVTDSAGNTATATIGVVSTNYLYAEWTPRWASAFEDWQVTAGSEFEGGYALTFGDDKPERTRYAISYDPVGEVADVELLDRFRVPEFNPNDSLGFHARAHLRSYTENGEQNGYWVEISNRDGAFRLGKYTDGGGDILATFGTPVEGTFYYRRFRADGTNLKIKVWPAVESEPAGWDVEVSDSDHASGWTGLGSYDPQLVETDMISVATGGDSAPFVDSNAAPTASWVRPAADDAVSGSVTVQIDASDAKDDDDSLEVTYTIDGGSSRSTRYNSTSGYYEDTWDTTTVSEGSHILEARATDSTGDTSTASIDLTTDNSTPPTVDDLLVSEIETRNPDAEFNVEWQVSDADGDLATLDVRLIRDADGSTQDSVSVGVSGDLTTGMARLVAAGADGSADDYTVELSVSDNNANTTTGTTSIRETNEVHVPSIDSYVVTEAGSSNPAIEITARWSASDADADLTTSLVEVIDSNGVVVESTTTSINGDTASGTNRFELEDTSDQSFDVSITVSDDMNQSVRRTLSVTE